MAFGPQAGLELVDALTSEPSLEGYHLLPSVRGDLLVKLGRWGEARPEFERAASLTRNLRERELLLERARACAGGGAPPEVTKASRLALCTHCRRSRMHDADFAQRIGRRCIGGFVARLAAVMCNTSSADKVEEFLKLSHDASMTWLSPLSMRDPR